MSRTLDSLTVEIIDSERKFTALEQEWDRLIAESDGSSFFSTFDFVHTAWKHFHGKADRLFILLVKRGERLVGIAPFMIKIRRIGGIPLIRAIKFIVEWGNGDKPTLVTTENPELIWTCIYRFLSTEFTQWESLYAMEQPMNSPLLKQPFFSEASYDSMVIQDSISFFVSLAGSWEEYKKNRSRNTRRNWSRYRKKLFALPYGINIHCFESSENLKEAIERFVSIEQSGWKKGCDFSVGGTTIQKKFHEELVLNLARKNMIGIYLLSSGNDDIAGVLIYKFKDIMYGGQITYNLEYAQYSPGVFLMVELIRQHFESHYKIFDFLGLQGEIPKNSFKRDWSTGEKETVKIMISKKNIRVFLYNIGKKLQRFLKNDAFNLYT